MTLLLASTFTDALARLTGDEQKAVKTTAFDLQVNPASPGLSFHKLERARDKRFWSVRVNADIRIIVHRSDESLLLCYVDHHDKAYAWAERRKLEIHPTTGAAQIVEIRETVTEIARPVVAPPDAPPPETPQRTWPLYQFTAETLMQYGVPEEWIQDVRNASEESLFEVLAHLPAEAAEAVLELATGGTPAVPVAVTPAEDPFAHPDAQRRFRVMQNAEELQRALDYPWDRWSVFLHPAQRELVERRYTGPARVAGTAGTGKTVVALHRAAHLARTNPGAKVLLTTFSVTLARMLRQKLSRLTVGEAGLAERITVDPIAEVGVSLYEQSFGTPRRATEGMIRSVLAEISRAVGGHSFSDAFLLNEWTEVVDAWRLTSWEAYRDVARLGRRTRLGEQQRATLWEIFTGVHQRLEEGAVFTPAMIFAAVASEVGRTGESPYQHIVVDEAQDINVPQLRFLAALAGARPDGLFFAGDLGQRIFQTPFSWKSLGVDVRGRSHTLRINYRTSHQIRSQADRLLDPEIADVDGNIESRRNAVSVFDGPEPEIRLFDDEAAEVAGVGQWIAGQVAGGVAPEEIGVFVRSPEQVPRARDAIRAAGLEPTAPAPGVDAEAGKVVLLPMHLAKGLEFRAVVTACCDDEVLPLQSRIESVTDQSDLEEVYNTERHLLYVACTRARDRLLVTGVKPGSEFLSDLGSATIVTEPALVGLTTTNPVARAPFLLRPSVINPNRWFPERPKASAWERIRKQVLGRDDFTCVSCGHRAMKHMTVHHRDHSGNDDLANLVTLCPACHAVLHIGLNLNVGALEIWESDVPQVEIVRRTRDGIRKGRTLREINGEFGLRKGRLAPPHPRWATELIQAMGDAATASLPEPLAAVFVKFTKWQVE